MTSSAFPAWRFKLQLQRIPLDQNLSVGITLAYQSPTLGAWRGIFVSVLIATLGIGWSYSS
jgi:hypothetical protein